MTKPADQLLWSPSALQIFGMFLRSTAEQLHGHLIWTETGLNNGTVYITLHRLENHGLVVSRVEGERLDGQSKRRRYLLTPSGLNYGNRLKSFIGVPASA